MIKAIKGDMIKMAQQGSFDVIGHGCNCFCRMGRGIAPLMNNAFECNNPEIFTLENKFYEGDIKKLGNYEARYMPRDGHDLKNTVTVCNMYTQYHWNDPGVYGIPFDYDAFALILRKMNHKFKSKEIALPGLIGAGLAKGDDKKIWHIIERELKECSIKIVFIDENKIPSWLDLS